MKALARKSEIFTGNVVLVQQPFLASEPGETMPQCTCLFAEVLDLRMEVLEMRLNMAKIWSLLGDTRFFLR